MTADLPAWIPAGPGTSPALPELEGRGGRVVVLLGTEGALSGGWAGAVAVDLVESWANAGARVVAVDAGLSTPLLHEALGIPNHEGLVDALRWGVSVQRAIQRPAGRRFLALTAGTAVADTAAVLELPRWHALCAGFREAGVTMAVLVPSWEEALGAVLKEADGVVVLAEPEEDLRDLFADLAVPVHAVTGVAPSGGLAAAAASPSPASDEDAPPPLDVVGGEPSLEGVHAEPPEEAQPVGEDAGRPAFAPAGGEEADDLPELSLAGDGESGDRLEGPFAGDEESESVPDAALAPDGESYDPPEVALVGDEASGDLPDFTLAGDEASGDLPDFTLAGDEASGDAPDFTLAGDEGSGDPPETPPRPWEVPPTPMLADELAEDDEDFVAGLPPGDASAAPFADADRDRDFVLPDPIPVPPSLEEIVEESEAPPPRRGRARMLLLLLLAVVVAVGVSAWLGYLEIPGLPLGRGAASSAPPSTPAVVEPEPATVTSPVQGYSLALGSFQDGDVAGRLVGSLVAQVPGVLFQSVPVEVDGTLVYRVLAGPAPDSAAVLRLSSRIAAGASLDPTSWVPRWTPLAFELGDMPDREAADRRVEVLNGLGVSGYVLAVDYSDGSTRYRVFAGAFEDAAEASYLSSLLDERGLSSSTLSERTGRLPE